MARASIAAEQEIIAQKEVQLQSLTQQVQDQQVGVLAKGCWSAKMATNCQTLLSEA